MVNLLWVIGLVFFIALFIVACLNLLEKKEIEEKEKEEEKNRELTRQKLKELEPEVVKVLYEYDRNFTDLWIQRYCQNHVLYRMSFYYNPQNDSCFLVINKNSSGEKALFEYLNGTFQLIAEENFTESTKMFNDIAMLHQVDHTIDEFNDMDRILENNGFSGAWIQSALTYKLSR